MPVTKFEIDRGTWIQGSLSQPAEFSRLLREDDGHRCCLGFYGLACGVPDDIMRGRTCFGNIRSQTPDIALPAEIEWLHEDPERNGDGMWDSTAALELMMKNDENGDPPYPSAERERDIAELFLKQGITVVFTGEYQTNG